MDNTNVEFQKTDLELIANLSTKIKSIYSGIDCNNCYKPFCGSCLNSIRQSLEYLCLYTCKHYNIKITKKATNGEIIENENPTLADLAPLIEKYFKENGYLWSKEIGTHIGSIWILGNLGSHAQKDMIEGNTDITRETIINAKNSMYVVTKWFFNHFQIECPISPFDNTVDNINNNDIMNKVELLLNKIDLIKQSNNKIDLLKQEINNQEFENIYWNELVEAIGSDSCVLFIGQDVSIDKNGKSLHENFYQSTEGRKITYNHKDGFFMPGADKQLKIKAINYYSKEFVELNKEGVKILKNISQIPFSLIISVSPDDTLHRIWSQFSKNHLFLFYNGQKQETREPTIETPIIYNLLGNTSKNGNYIFTHEQFYEYINEKKEVKIPTEIETKVKDAAHYLFLGIDFNKWHNRLLLFSLNLNGEGYSLNNRSIEELNQDFVYQQFNVSCVSSNYQQFVEILVRKCKEAGHYKPLIDNFIENTICKLEKIKSGQKTEESINELSEIERKIADILNE
jgi:hypothetical protein